MRDLTKYCLFVLLFLILDQGTEQAKIRGTSTSLPLAAQSTLETLDTKVENLSEEESVGSGGDEDYDDGEDYDDIDEENEDDLDVENKDNVDEENDEDEENEDDVDEENDEDDTGSTDRLTSCDASMSVESSFGPYTPSCTDDGKFEQVQCITNKKCWCVDENGIEFPGSRLQSMNKLKCDSFELSTTPTYKIQTTSDISFEDDGNDISPNAGRVVDPHTETETQFILHNPFILAAIVGGSIILLVCIILVIVYVIYRLRKRDEGTYALEEQKKLYPFAYKKAKDQEFFA